jgi:DUF971 family protein
MSRRTEQLQQQYAERVQVKQRAESSVVRPDQALLDIRIPSADEQGHSKRQSVEMPPNVHAQLHRCVEQGEYGFDSVGEFVRWAIVFAMDYLERLDAPPYKSMVQVIKAVAEDNTQALQRREYLTSIEKSSGEVFELMGLGLHDEAERHIMKVLTHVRGLRRDDPFRKLYVDAIQTRFGRVLRSGAIADLSKVEWQGQEQEPDQDDER